MGGLLIVLLGIPLAIFALAMVPGRWIWWGLLASAWVGFAVWVWATRFAGPPPAGSGLGYALEQAFLAVYGWVGAVGLVGRAVLIAQRRQPLGSGRGPMLVAAAIAFAPPLIMVTGYWQ